MMKKQKQLEKVTATYIEPQNLRLTCVAVAARQQRKRRTKNKWVQLDLFDDCEDSERKLPEILTLTLKTKWWNMIKDGTKREEYREQKTYWAKRLEGRKYDKVVFTLGYPKRGDTERRMEKGKPTIRKGTGREEWGAETGREYYVISWEELDNIQVNGK